MSLDDLPLRQSALIEAINWSALSPADGKRLRELGFDEGVTVQPLHRASFGRDPHRLQGWSDDDCGAPRPCIGD